MPRRTRGTVRTAHRRGYAFCGEAEDLDTQPSAGTVATFWLVVMDKRVILGPGETTIGRDPASGVWLDVPSVSWRHARVDIQGRAAAIQDLESTNGTYVCGRKVSEATPLRHGDAIQFGEVKATFGASSGVAAARTERLRRTGSDASRAAARVCQDASRPAKPVIAGPRPRPRDRP